MDNSLPIGQHIQINALDRSGLFLNCNVNSVAVNLLVDSGSPVTILNVGAYQRLSGTRPDIDSVDVTLWGIGRREIPVIGKTVIQFTILGKLFEQETMIADLGFDLADGILGEDFMNKHDGALYFRKKVLKLGKSSVCLAKGDNFVCSRVRITESTVVPAESEVHIKAFVDGETDHNEGMVEPAKLLDSKGILLPRTLVKTENGEILLSVLNTNTYPEALNWSTVVATLHPVVKVTSENYVVNSSCLLKFINSLSLALI